MIQRIVRNVGVLTGAQLIARALNFVLLAALARSLGSEGAGGYATAVSVSLIVLLVSDLGLSPRLIREASADPERRLPLFHDTLAWKLALVPLTGLGIAAAALFLPYPAEVRGLVVWMGAAAILLSFAQTNEALLRAREAMHWEALASIAQSVLTTGLTLALLLAGGGLLVTGAARVMGALASLALTGFVLRRDLSFGGRRERATLQGALPYLSTASMNLAYGQIDILLLSLVTSQSAVGEYALISRIVLVAGTFASTGAAGFLPTLARAFAREGDARFRQLTAAALGAAAVAGILAALGLRAVGGFVITLAYGDAFAHLVPLFATATTYVLLRFLSAALGMVLTAADRQGTRATCILLGLVATVVLIVLWVPSRGVEGAIDALVASELTLVACLAVAAWPVLRRPGAGVAAD